MIYIYLYYFCYTIFNHKSLEIHDWKYLGKNFIYKLLYNEQYRKDFMNINKNQYENIMKIMEKNFNVLLIRYNDVIKVVKRIEECKINKITNDENFFSQKKDKKFKITLFNFIFFLFFHNIILITITIVSLMIYDVISAIYICFCLYYFYTSKSISKGKLYSYPNNIKNFLRVFVITDVISQLIMQIIYMYFKISENDTFGKFLNVLGFKQIFNDKYEITNKIILGKCFCFFFICI